MKNNKSPGIDYLSSETITKSRLTWETGNRKMREQRRRAVTCSIYKKEQKRDVKIREEYHFYIEHSNLCRRKHRILLREILDRHMHDRS